MSSHRRTTKRPKARRPRTRRQKTAIAVAVVVTVGAVGIPTIAQASGSGLGGWRSVASSWWGGDPSDRVTDPAPPKTPSTPSASPNTSDADPSPTTSPSRKPRAARTSPTPSASPSKSKSPAAKPPVSAPEKQAAPASTPKATEADRAPRDSSSGADSGPTDRVLVLVNAEREKAGCAPLAEDAKLTKAAQNHSQDMADHRNMSHTGSDGSSMGDRLARVGYPFRSAGENVAAGYGTPESVMDGWMNSPGHRANILNCGFKEIGIGLAQPGNYWTQNFGTPA